MTVSEIPFQCPNCGHKFHKSFGWLKTHRVFPCPRGCGATINAEELVTGLLKAEKKLSGGPPKTWTIKG